MHIGIGWPIDVLKSIKVLITLIRDKEGNPLYINSVIGTVVLATIFTFATPYIVVLLQNNPITLIDKIVISLLALGFGWLLGSINWLLSRIWFYLPEYLQGITLGVMLGIWF